jgi:GGDEF domain-containing protein
VVSRYGGDESAVVMPGASERAVRHVAERLERLLVGDLEPPRLTASWGVATSARRSYAGAAAGRR